MVHSELSRGPEAEPPEKKNGIYGHLKYIKIDFEQKNGIYGHFKYIKIDFEQKIGIGSYTAILSRNPTL